jgi:hypothetical protein
LLFLLLVLCLLSLTTLSVTAKRSFLPFMFWWLLTFIIRLVVVVALFVAASVVFFVVVVSLWAFLFEIDNTFGIFPLFITYVRG